METQPPTPGSRLERSGSNPRKHPPTSLYIGSDWSREPGYGGELEHLTELQGQIERAQQQEHTREQQYLTQQHYTTEQQYSKEQQSYSRQSKQQLDQAGSQRFSQTSLHRQGSSTDMKQEQLEKSSQEQLPGYSTPKLSGKVNTPPSDKGSLGKSSLGKSSMGHSSSSGESPAATAAALGVKKKEKKSSLSSIFSVFSRKKSSKDGERKKSSLAGMLESSGSVLSPDVHKSIIDEREEGRVEEERRGEEEDMFVIPASPDWRREPPYVTQTYIQLPAPDTPILGLSRGGTPYGQSRGTTPLGPSRGTTPDPDYDNMSLISNSPRAPRLRPFDGHSSDTSCDEYGRYTPRSVVSEYRPRGAGRGVSPSLSEPPTSRRAPSTDSFFAKNGASLVAGGSSSQVWYQRYKHQSFTSSHQTTFGELPRAAFDGRITNIRGEEEEEEKEMEEVVVADSCIEVPGTGEKQRGQYISTVYYLGSTWVLCSIESIIQALQGVLYTVHAAIQAVNVVHTFLGVVNGVKSSC